MNIPVSLLPDSTIPKLEIVIDNPGESASKFDNEVVSMIRNNLYQVSELKDLNSYSSEENSKIELLFN